MKLDVTVVGGGMITHDQILPSLYHLQRLGAIGHICVCALNSAPLRALAEEDRFQRAFPGQSFEAFPDLSADPAKMYPNLFEEVVGKMPAYQLVVVAVPDQLHYQVIKFAFEHDQHVLTVKPLVLKYTEAVELEQLAKSRGLFVGVEYHKRFDRRSLDARVAYRQGKFGQFRCGEAKLVEPWYYRHSNFQNWFTTENTDPFTYIGCHYVDLVYFITGLRPVEVSQQGVVGKFPNGNEGYMWSGARVVFENGGILSVVTGLGYPDDGAGSNDQGMCLFCEGDDCGGLIKHDDQFRGVSHSYVDGGDAKAFHYVNPDYMRLVVWEGAGLKPVGYGYDSIEANVMSAVSIAEGSQGLSKDQAMAKRRQMLEAIDEKGIIATPANSYINELVMEAGRMSIAGNGARIGIEYGKSPRVRAL